MTAPEFRTLHGDPTTWTATDIETYDNLRRNDAYRQEQDVLRSAEQAVAIEAVRAHLEAIQVEPPLLAGTVDPGRLTGRLMTAEVLLDRVARAFTPAA